MKRKKLTAVLCMLFWVCLLFSACRSKKDTVKPIEADRVVFSHEDKNGVRDAETMVTDEETVSELVLMHNTLQIQAMSRPMPLDRFVLTFYSGDNVVAEWLIAIWSDDGMIITGSSETFGVGNYVVKSNFDYDRLMGILMEYEK